MLKNMVSCLILILSLNAFAGPILVGRGAGFSEYSLIFARANLELLLQDCVALSCELAEDQRSVGNELVSRARLAPQLEFKSGAEMGTDEVFRRLSDKVVWINQDKLWTDAAKTVPYGMGEAMALWCQILGEGLEAGTLARVEESVRVTFQRQVVRSELTTEPKRSFEFLLWKRPGAVDQLAIRDVVLQSVVLTEPIASQLACASGVKSMEIFSPVWSPDLRGDEQITLILNFGVRWVCVGEEGRGGSSLGHAIIDAHADADGVFIFDSSSLFVSVETGGSHR
jgi:hypothetical protein